MLPLNTDLDRLLVTDILEDHRSHYRSSELTFSLEATREIRGLSEVDEVKEDAERLPKRVTRSPRCSP